MRGRILIVAAVAALAAGPGRAETAAPGIACKVSGYDVILLNEGTEAIAEGVEVVWSVPFARMEGRFTLEKPLEPGALAFITAALGSSYLGSDTPCIAELAVDEDGTPGK